MVKSMFVTSCAYGKNLDVLQRCLNASVLRRQVIANNIANADTPHYKRSAVTFESALNRAFASEVPPDEPTKTTSNKHISFNIRKDYKQVTANVVVEFDTNQKNDKNNVDIETEISHEVKNALHFNALTQAVSNSFRLMRVAIG